MSTEAIQEYEIAIRDHATVDLAAQANKAARRREYITHLRDCIVHCDSVTMPATLLQGLKADAAMLRATGNLVTAQAIVAAVERHAAAKPLCDVDGVATIGVRGRAHTLLTQALEWHRRASEQDTKIANEERRIALIKDLEK